MMILMLAALLSVSEGSAQTRSVPLTEEQIRSLDPIGSCEGGGRAIDLRKVLFLENRSVDTDWPEGTLRLSLSGDYFYADEVINRQVSRQHYQLVLDSIQDGSDLDIELKFAYFEGELLLYWKETFQNRLYRQGLFKISGPNLTFLCEGRGGRLAVR